MCGSFPKHKGKGGQDARLGVHEERLEVTLVVNEELLVTAREDVARLLVRAVTNLGHRELTLEPATNAVVNTLGLAPCLLDTVVTVRLVALLLVARFRVGSGERGKASGRRSRASREGAKGERK